MAGAAADGVLFGSSKAHKELRQMLVEQHKLDAVISLASGVFRPYAGVSTAIPLFTKTGVGGTGNVWFYNLQADDMGATDDQAVAKLLALLSHRIRMGPKLKKCTVAQPCHKLLGSIQAIGHPLSLLYARHLIQLALQSTVTQRRQLVLSAPSE